MSLLALAAVPADADDDGRVLLADQADGIIETSGIGRLEVRGIQGTLTLRPGQPGKLRFACRSLDNKREERPVSLYETDSAMLLAFSEQLAAQSLLLEVAVPPELRATVEADDSKLIINSLQGPLEVRGSKLSFGGRNLGGDVELELTGGSVTIVSSKGDVDLKGREVTARLTQIDGAVDAEMVGGRLELLEIQGEVVLDLEQTEVVGELVGAAVSATATGGALAFNQLRAGGIFELSEAPLEVLASAGEIEVDTDAAVQFENLDGGLQVRSYGGGLTGTAAKGAVLFDGSEGEVRLGQLGADVTIRGDRLNVQVDGVKGNLTIHTTSSEVVVSKTEGEVDLSNDFGDVSVTKASRSVKVVSSQGAVAIHELEATATVKADGPEVTVHWSGSARDAESVVENASGDVRLLFSPKGGGRLEVEASYGRIESSVNGVTVADDGTKASGIINRIANTTIRVVSGGDVYLAGAPMVGKN